MNMPLIDHGENDPIPFELDRKYTAEASIARTVIHLHRQQLNDQDKAREMASLEREIEAEIGRL
jgi:hypothetical protein